MPDAAFEWVPAHVSTYGDIAADLGGHLDLEPDKDQRRLLDAMFAERGKGERACFEVAVIAPRQNLKTAALQLAAMTDLFVDGVELVIWTAHVFDTAEAAFHGMKRLIGGNEFYRSQCVWPPHRAHGEQAIELLTGQKIEFHARATGSGRGLTGDVVILDEALYLDRAMMGDFLPTMATRENAQVRYASSAGKVGSSVLRGIRDRGRPGGDPDLAYFEWCAPRTPCVSDECSHARGSQGCVLDDREMWRAANPAMGRKRNGISERRMAQFRNALPPEEFAREFLGWWDDPPTGIDGTLLVAWDLLADVDLAGTPTALAVDVAPGRMSSSVAGAIRRPDGLPQLDLLAHWPGTAGVVELLAAKSAKFGLPVLLDPTAEAGSLIAALEKSGVRVVEVSGREMTQACGEFAGAVADGQLRHLGDPVLSTALAAARQRDVGDGAWRWSRTNSAADISPMVAATLALHGHLTHAGPSVYESRDLVVL